MINYASAPLIIFGLGLLFPLFSKTFCLKMLMVYITVQLTKNSWLANQSKKDFLLSNLCIFISVFTIYIFIRFLLFIFILLILELTYGNSKINYT